MENEYMSMLVISVVGALLKSPQVDPLPKI